MITSEEIEYYRSTAERFFGISIPVRYVDERAFYMTYGAISLSRAIFSFPRTLAKRELYHEIAHRVFAPRTPGNELLWQMIANMEGIGNSRDFLNVTADAFVEYNNLRTDAPTPYRFEYARGLREELESLDYSRLPPPAQFLAAFDILLLSKFGYYEVLGVPLPRSMIAMAKRAYRIISGDEDEAEKVREIAILIGKLFRRGMYYADNWNQVRGASEKEKEERCDGERSRGGAGSEPEGDEKRGAAHETEFMKLFITPILDSDEITDKEAEDVVEKLTRMYGLSGLERVMRAARENKKVYRRIILRKAYSLVLPIIQTLRGSHPDGTVLAISKWNVDRPVGELDVKASARRYGTIIPGITALAKTRVEEPGYGSTGSGNMLLVLDASGSMMGEKIDRVVEVAAGLIEVARNFGDQFSVIAINDNGLDLELEPSYDYNKAIMKIIDIEGSGNLSMHLIYQKMLEFAEMTKKQLTVVLSDCIPPDDFTSSAYRERIRKLAQHGPVIFIVLTDKMWISVKNALKGIPNSFPVLVQDPAKPFAPEVLEPVWRAIESGNLRGA